MTEPRLTGNKHCNHCDRDLPVICFPVNRKSTDGLCHLCRECNREYKKTTKLKERKLHKPRSFDEIYLQKDCYEQKKPK